MTVLLLVTLVSLVLAVVMTAVAWRVAREERARADARVTALAADIQSAVAAAGGRRTEPVLRAVRPHEASVDLFTASSAGTSRSVLVVGIGLFAFATAAALAVVLTSGGRATRASDTTRQTAQAPTDPTYATHQTPLELVALGHERDGDRLLVRGVVRNPPTAAATSPLTAVVFAFDRDGGFVTSGRAAIDARQLAPGSDSTFVVNLPHAERVVRYRVSFRTDAAIVPHVDKRRAS